MSFKRQTENALEIPANSDTEEGTKERTLWKRRRLFGTKNQSTPNVTPEIVSDAYMDSKIFDARFYADKVFHIVNRHATYGLYYKIYACIDPNKWYELLGETLLAAATDAMQWDDGKWAYYKVSVKNETGGNAATVEAYGSGQS